VFVAHGSAHEVSLLEAVCDIRVEPKRQVASHEPGDKLRGRGPELIFVRIAGDAIDHKSGKVYARGPCVLRWGGSQ
jgi:hypothetical protein